MSSKPEGKSTFEKKPANTSPCLRPRPHGWSRFASENFESCDVEPKYENKDPTQVCLL